MSRQFQAPLHQSLYNLITFGNVTGRNAPLDLITEELLFLPADSRVTPTVVPFLPPSLYDIFNSDTPFNEDTFLGHQQVNYQLRYFLSLHGHNSGRNLNLECPETRQDIIRLVRALLQALVDTELAERLKSETFGDTN